MILLLSANSWWILGYRKFSIKFPREACLFQAHLRESLIDTGWGGAYLIQKRRWYQFSKKN